MPLVRIITTRDLSAGERARVSDAVQAAVVAAIDVPPEDRFYLFARAAVHAAPSFLGIAHSDALTVVEVTLTRGRDLEKKRRLYRGIADGVAATLAIATDDVMIVLTEVGRDDWSFGRGEASYADPAA